VRLRRAKVNGRTGAAESTRPAKHQHARSAIFLLLLFLLMQLSLLLFLQLLIHPFSGFLQQLLVFRPCLLGRGSMPRPTAPRPCGLAVCATLLHPLRRQLCRSHQNLLLLLVFLLPFLLLPHSSALLQLA
jgi:hypothetical protein